ncbi:hypothetical protein [Pseudoalteromonas luteoviolacea]|uniref:Type 4 secretion system PilS N-terminal domain-containing protein n=1 Tax=Pseudoalteromonas luteoviolacea S4060-1 TaxID=1365257 RepID=A0A162C7F0_9GAMM|nr:hypothetical protein [Pseudoalteromonas luteoviolacea]KZN63393.1 hypothetical protein N478_03830 [Pseudoalteromonas luteoviolacea S4060-1]
MKFNSRLKSFCKEGGFLSLELGAVLGVVVIASALAVSRSDMVAAKGDEKALVEDIGLIIEGARQAAYSEENRFEDVTIEKLSELRLVPERWGDGSNANPHNGSYDLSDSTATSLVVTASGLNSDLCTRGAEIINKNFTATCSGDTVTVTAS